MSWNEEDWPADHHFLKPRNIVADFWDQVKPGFEAIRKFPLCDKLIPHSPHSIFNHAEYAI